MCTLIIVDVQRDFCEGGALPVEGGNRVARKIERYVENTMFDRVVATRDFHLPDSDNGGHFDEWPAHCVQHTPGADYAFDTTFVTQHVIKGMGKPAYSALEGVDAATLEPFTVEPGEDVWVVGIATDFCVKQTALDALEAGANVTVIADHTAAVGDIDTALDELREAGVMIR